MHVCCHILRELAEGSPRAAVPITLERVLETLCKEVGFAVARKRDEVISGFIEDGVRLLLVLLKNDECRNEVPIEGLNIILWAMCRPYITKELSSIIVQFICDYSVEPEVIELLLCTNCIGELVRCLGSPHESVQVVVIKCCYVLLKLNSDQMNTQFKSAGLLGALERIKSMRTGTLQVAAQQLAIWFKKRMDAL